MGGLLLIKSGCVHKIDDSLVSEACAHRPLRSGSLGEHAK
jgi:hypothetical protein